MMSAFTTNAESLSAGEILAIPAGEPERIFPRDRDGIKKLKRSLSMLWHPDHNKDPMADDVLGHIIKLSKSATEKLEAGTWHVPGILVLEDTAGKAFRLKYLKKHNFELGEFYISASKLTYVVRGDYKDLFDNGVKAIKGLKFANDKMRKGLEIYFPKINKTFETKNGDHVLVVERDPDAILLRDCFNHAAGTIDPRNVAWILSRFHNFTSYMQWAGMTHNAITLDNCFIIPKDRTTARTASKSIAPKDHSLLVLGGWWYAASAGRPLLGLPPQAVNYAPRSALSSGRADFQIDNTMIRVAARELLGDASGVRLVHDKKIPKAMSNWLTLPGSGDAIEDFTTWHSKILIDSFGPRKFVEMDIDPDEVYQPQP